MKTLVALQFLNTAVVISAIRPECKCTPNDECWPSPSEWSTLNTTLSGALIYGNPPASVCYPNQPNYNEEACAIVRSQWFNSTFHASNPVSIDYPIWTNNSCNPIYPNGTSLTGDANAEEKGCSIGAYPAYVVNATNEEQVATALKWAGGHNIRVIVKGTGHSYTGRSIGYGSLSIWTHNLRGIQYLEEFTPTRCPIPNPLSAVRVAAGHTGEEIQFYLAEYNKVVVTGANPSVGIIGWLTGGGHGYLSSTYGLGSDNLLEATVVLPSGETILTNPCQNGDIFFALRGGGGGTYGVVTRVVLKTYPSPKTTMHVFALTSLPATPEIPFWATIGYLHAEMQRLKDGGMQGYYYIVGPPAYPTLSLLWVFMLFDKPQNTVETLMAPIEAYLAERKGLFAYTSNATHGATYISLAQYIESESVASGSSTYGSRLLSPASLSDANRTANTLARIGPSRNASTPNGPISNPILIGHMIAPSSALPSYYPSSSSLNPAWRNALVHLVVVQGWPDDTPASRVKDVYEDITTKTGVLRTLSPETGAYFNEANANEVDWEGSFFGQNYGSLRAIKRYVDPGDVLWCRRCVGSEALVEGDEGQLCRARNEEVADSEEPELR